MDYKNHLYQGITRLTQRQRHGKNDTNCKIEHPTGFEPI